MVMLSGIFEFLGDISILGFFPARGGEMFL